MCIPFNAVSTKPVAISLHEGKSDVVLLPQATFHFSYSTVVRAAQIFLRIRVASEHANQSVHTSYKHVSGE